MFRTVYNKFDFTAAYTLSSMQLENEILNNGEPFDAEWDRRHQLNFATGYQISPELGINASYIFATGTPNNLFDVEDRLNQDNGRELPEERLSAYARLDLSLNFQSRNREGPSFEANVFLFNLLNRNNVWYRELRLALDRNGTAGNRFQSLPVDVYDMGFQPSFNLIFYF